MSISLKSFWTLKFKCTAPIQYYFTFSQILNWWRRSLSVLSTNLWPIHMPSVLGRDTEPQVSPNGRWEPFTAARLQLVYECVRMGGGETHATTQRLYISADHSSWWPPNPSASSLHVLVVWTGEGVNCSLWAEARRTIPLAEPLNSGERTHSALCLWALP